ncbi:MAG: translation initiation factor IF-2 [Candidatus Bathyarchaeota archaeon]|nr:MAG: translation initiation factor IF-2 [Candidatus Bathyarchaeota archaeon]
MRQPIVCMLGHVDTGKTSLLDKIRGSAVQLREAGGLTQQIGASYFPLDTLIAITKQLLTDFSSTVKIPGLLVVDTPGHEAFANLRRRGGSVADIAILVIDVMHGFENQTYESIEILKSRKTPFIVAANKIDRIDGWRVNEDTPFLASYAKQAPLVKEDVDNRLYTMMGTLSRQGFRSERFDRVRDFTHDIAIVPVSAKTGEGVGELLAVLIGLTQQFMADKLQVTSDHALGTVLEVREEIGLGTTINAIIYDGVLRSEDTIVIGGKSGPLTTGIRSILLPQPLDEIRDPRKKFNAINEAPAASGVKIAAPDLEDAVAGAPLIAVGGSMTLERAVEEVSSELERLRISTDNVGVILKTDTLGSLEALLEILRARDVPVRLADIGDISRREVIEAVSVKYEEPLYGAILAFNVRLLPDAEREAHDQRIPVFTGDIIYNLMDEYTRWIEEEREAKARKEFDLLVKPGKIEVMEGFVFRRAKPAIFGVRVLNGNISPNVYMINLEGTRVGRITQIQDSGEAIQSAEEGKEVAVSMPTPIVGRHIKERDVLIVDVPEKQAKLLREKYPERLTAGAHEALRELTEIKRKKDLLWAF